jgi:hypothetical protein
MAQVLPEGINGHFGPELRRFVLAQYVLKNTCRTAARAS